MPEPGPGTPAKPPSGQLVRIDEAVVHDLSHELGNYFHKLYYWVEHLRSDAEEAGGEPSPAQSLDETLHRLQDFLNLALVYFEPATAVTVTMTGADVAGALEALLRGENAGATVEVGCAPEAAGAALQIDTQRLSAGLRVIARLIGGGGAAGTHLRASLTRKASAAGDVLEIALATTGGAPDAAARRAQRVVEWAVAARAIELHGGELVTNEERSGAACCVLTLPLTI